MIVHLFNSSSVSGPERLVLPALASFGERFMIVNLREDRIGRLRECDPLEEYSRSLNLRYECVRVQGRWDRAALNELQRLLERLDPDLVHAHAIKASVYLLQSGRRGGPRRFPVVSTHHGAQGVPDWKVRMYECLYRRYSLRFFDRVLCVSGADYEFLRSSGIDPDRLRLHRNGMNGRFVAPEDRPKEAPGARVLWFPQEAERDRLFLFGVVARLSPEKDHDRLLRVLSCLNQRPCDRDWRCLIFGSGALETKLRRQARRWGLEQKVVWMGHRKTVGEELAGLDLLLSFSKAEGLPINLIEAGWAGTPVMSTLVGGVVELIPDETCGHGMFPAEPVSETTRRLRAFLTEEGREKLSAQGRRFQERVTREFTQENWIQRLREIYFELKVELR